jgi:hypothetical protein
VNETRYVAPIAVELLVREAQTLRGYPAGDRRSVRLSQVQAELTRLGAGDQIDEDEDEGWDDPDTLPPPDLNREGDPAFNEAFLNRW